MDCNCKSIEKCIGTEKLINCKKLVETAETAEHNGFDCWIEDMESCDKDDCENCDC
tara:strand:+ start:2871 stop:3038 length:168 start_codon:yes stop_codon:yes gene_type:complete